MFNHSTFFSDFSKKYLSIPAVFNFFFYLSQIETDVLESVAIAIWLSKKKKTSGDEGFIENDFMNV